MGELGVRQVDLRVFTIILGSVAYLAALLYFLVDQIGWVVFWLRSVEVPGRTVRTYTEHIGTDEYGHKYIVDRSEVEFETSDGSTRRVIGSGKSYSYTVRYDPRTENPMLAGDLRSGLITGSIIVAVFLLGGVVMAFAFARYVLA